MTLKACVILYIIVNLCNQKGNILTSANYQAPIRLSTPSFHTIDRLEDDDSIVARNVSATLNYRQPDRQVRQYLGPEDGPMGLIRPTNHSSGVLDKSSGYELKTVTGKSRQKIRKKDRAAEEEADELDVMNSLVQVLGNANKRLMAERKALDSMDLFVINDSPLGNNTNRSHVQLLPSRISREDQVGHQVAASSNVIEQQLDRTMSTQANKKKKKKKRRLVKKKKMTRNYANSMSAQGSKFRESLARPDSINSGWTIEETANVTSSSRNSTGARRLETAADHNLVRPGFNHSGDTLNADRTDTLMRRQATRHQYPETVSLDPLGLAKENSIETNDNYNNKSYSLHKHKPIVAKDLLHVPPRAAQQQSDARYFVKHGGGDDSDQQHRPLVEYENDHEGANFRPGPMYESRVPYGRRPLLNNELIGEHYEPMTTAKPPITRLIDGRHQSAPYTMSPLIGTSRPQLVDWRPLLGGAGALTSPSPLAHRLHGGLPAVIYGHPYDTSPPQHQLQYEAMPERELNQRIGERTQSPLIVNPLQQLLMAAKNQQAEALDYERRRLNYEQELRKREELMRQQHDANLARERERQQQQQQQEQQQKQQQQQQQQEQQQQQQKQQQQQQQQQQQPQQEENNEQANDNNEQNNNEEQQNDEQEQGNNNNSEEQNQQQDDPDMKNFQSFAGGDTDFTDLFPPGILSEAEIKEMRKQQEEQKRRQEQEEQEEREKQQEGGGEGGEGEGGGGGGENEQPTQEDQQVQQVSGNELTNGTQLEAKSGGATTANVTQTVANHTQSLHATPATKANNTTSSSDNQTGASKVRRSHLPQPLLVLESEYQDRYLKPYLASLTATSAGYDSRQNRKSTPDEMPGDFWRESSASNAIVSRADRPLIEFDDLAEDGNDESDK